MATGGQFPRGQYRKHQSEAMSSKVALIPAGTTFHGRVAFDNLSLADLGSLLAALDVHPRIAMAILRHSRIALTMEIYTQVPDNVTRDALRRLSDWLDHDEDQDDEDRS